mmetsp:Transcript_19264/g.50885  ORF Transcript_19264/g.50885 Transcript_19264/m.50885 type:complete len:106 (-) Transcript_19264:1002-1319(-)
MQSEPVRTSLFSCPTIAAIGFVAAVLVVVTVHGWLVTMFGRSSATEARRQGASPALREGGEASRSVAEMYRMAKLDLSNGEPGTEGWSWVAWLRRHGDIASVDHA